MVRAIAPQLPSSFKNRTAACLFWRLRCRSRACDWSTLRPAPSLERRDGGAAVDSGPWSCKESEQASPSKTAHGRPDLNWSISAFWLPAAIMWPSCRPPWRFSSSARPLKKLSRDIRGRGEREGRQRAFPVGFLHLAFAYGSYPTATRLKQFMLNSQSIACQAPMIADELRRQADGFVDLSEWRARVGRDPSDRPALRRAPSTDVV